MAAGAFDTLAAVRELQAAGIQAGQAEAIVTAIHRSSGEHVSSSELRSELAELRSHVDVSASELKTEVAELRSHVDVSVSELKAELGELRSHVDVSVSALRSELAELRAHIDTSIAGLRGELYRALWLQAAAIVGALTALDALLGG